MFSSEPHGYWLSCVWIGFLYPGHGEPHVLVRAAWIGPLQRLGKESLSGPKLRLAVCIFFFQIGANLIEIGHR